MKFDRLKSEKLMSSFRHALTHLKRLAQLSPSEFIGDPDKTGSAKYYFIMAIEAAVDIAQHLIARNDLRLPEDYADVFRVLSEAGVLPQEFLPTLTQMARFRNRLVHLYWDVDDAFIYDTLRSRIGDLDRLLGLLSLLLQGEPGPEQKSGH